MVKVMVLVLPRGFLLEEVYIAAQQPDHPVEFREQVEILETCSQA